MRMVRRTGNPVSKRCPVELATRAGLPASDWTGDEVRAWQDHGRATPCLGPQLATVEPAKKSVGIE